MLIYSIIRVPVQCDSKDSSLIFLPPWIHYPPEDGSRLAKEFDHMAVQKKAGKSTISSITGIPSAQLTQMQFQQQQECFQMQQAQRQEFLQLQQQQSQELRQLQQVQSQQVTQLAQKQNLQIVEYEETSLQALQAQTDTPQF